MSRLPYYTCEDCGARFNDPLAKIVHKQKFCQRASRAPKIWRCQFCRRELPSDAACRDHERSCEGVPHGEGEAQSSVRTYRCRYCNIYWNSKQNFEIHESECAQAKPQAQSQARYNTFKCRYCQAEWNSEENCSTHESECRQAWAQSSPPQSSRYPGFKCRYCQVEWNTIENRDAHELECLRRQSQAQSQAQSQTPSGRFRCRYCGTEWNVIANGIIHERSCRG